jgi:tight adherence protein B
MDIIILIFVFISVFLTVFGIIPFALDRYKRIQEKKVEKATKKLDELYVEIQRKKLSFLFFLAPIVLFVIAFIFTQNLFIGAGAGILGFAIPNLVIAYMERRRKQKIDEQLIESLVVLSGGLKAGLSLLQAFEVLAEDMPPPLSQEISHVLKEVRIGVSLEDSLRKWSNRLRSRELSLIVNSIAVAQVTGGDLVKVFNRLVTTLRNSRKLQENVKTLTLQGKMQGLILSILPFLFAWWVLAFNRNYFKVMLESEKGRSLLLAAVVLQVIGLFLIRKFSKVKI